MIDALPLLLGPEGYQISRSVRLRNSASAYFSRNMAGTNATTWTVSFWFKTGLFDTNVGVPTVFEYVETTGAGRQGGISGNNPGTAFQVGFYKYAPTTYTMRKIPAMVFRDPSAWYHAVFVWNTTSATAEDRAQIWINGSRVTAWTTNTNPALNETWLWSIFTNNFIGAQNRNNGGSILYPFDGYLTEINFIDGQALTPASFGETNPVTGVWQPKKYTGTYGTNGFYLNFSDPSAATAAAIGKDYSGNGNNWTPNNISVTAGATYDSMLDVPTPWADGGNGRGNYCTLNPLDTSQNGNAGTLSNGNLTRTESTATNSATFGTMFVSSGQWYYEVLVQAINNTGTNVFAMISTNSKSVSVGLRPDGTALNASASGSGTYTTNDVLGVAVDIGANSVYVYKNGTLLRTLTPTTALIDFTPAIAEGTGVTGAVTASFNFGQQPFAYTPPTGFKALNTQNLPTPTILKGNQYFDVNTWSGNASTQVITNSASMQPDLVWIKKRGGGTTPTRDHRLFDAVRGATKYLGSNLTSAEVTETDGLTSFNANGFTLGASDGVNGTTGGTGTYVGWQWKEGATQGFDIVTYTGNGAANRTVSHALGVTPAMVIVRNRSSIQNWRVWHQSLAGSQSYLGLNQTAAAAISSTVFNGFSSTTFTVGTDPSTNENASNHVAYLFAEVAGFSRFGSYTGNGSADGPFVFCGFRPRWIMIKETTAASTSDWVIHDTARASFNADDLRLLANSSGAELNTGFPIDELSNGFKIRNTGNGANRSGGTYIFAAFAENPFKYSLAR